MAERGVCLALELRNDPLGQDLAEFPAPLIERVNIPDRALGEHAVLVKANQLAQNFRGQPIGENRVRWTVALKDAVGYEPVRCALCLDLLWRLSECQRLSLGQDVCQEHVVVSAKGNQRLAKRDEVTGDEP